LYLYLYQYLIIIYFHKYRKNISQFYPSIPKYPHPLRGHSDLMTLSAGEHNADTPVLAHPKGRRMVSEANKNGKLHEVTEHLCLMMFNDA